MTMTKRLMRRMAVVNQCSTTVQTNTINNVKINWKQKEGVGPLGISFWPKTGTD